MHIALPILMYIWQVISLWIFPPYIFSNGFRIEKKYKQNNKKIGCWYFCDLGGLKLQNGAKGCKHIIAPSWKQSFTSLFYSCIVQGYLQNVCSINPANVLQLIPLIPLVCSIQPANNFSVYPKKCLKHPTCKQFAASNLQNICSNQPAKYLQHQPAKYLQHPIFKIFAVSNLQNICSIQPANYLQHSTFKIYVASNLQIICSI